MNETCRRTAWPSEAADCSAARSGSASRTATSVMADDISFNSCARQTSSARNQNSAIGKLMVAAATTIIGLAKNELPVGETWDATMAHTSKAPTASQPPEAAAASWKGRLDGCCCKAKIRPPIEGTSSLAAIWARAGPAGRRLAGRRPAWSPPDLLLPPPVLLPGLSEPRPPPDSVGGIGGGASAVSRVGSGSFGGPVGSAAATGPGTRSAASRCVFPS